MRVTMLGQGSPVGKKAPPRSGRTRRDSGRTLERKTLSADGRTKIRLRDPLPMKMRALPQSFWQQPNQSSAPGGSACPPLPLLTGTAEASKCTPREREEVVSAANTDLLFSLFRGVDKVAAEVRRKEGSRASRRGRPRKTVVGVREEDPCLVSAVADSIRPLLQKEPADGQQILPMAALPEVQVPLPALDAHHDYSQILSKLVMKL